MKKGFTLVELLGTIILLGLLSFVVAVPIVARINKNARRINEATITMLREYVISYIDTDRNDFRSKIPGTVYYITLDELSYNEDGINNLYKNKNLDEYTQVKVEIDSKGEYQVSILETPNETLKDLYISGGEYVLFNGILWRMISHDEENKTIKLASNEFVGSIQKGTKNNYSDTYVYKWLNNYFIGMLNYTNVIKDNVYGDVEAKVGLLTASENQNYSLSGNTYFVLNNGNLVNNDSTTNNASLIRPVITVFDGTVVTDGDGLADSPYILRDNQNDQKGASLKNADISIGQYITFNDNLYRIIEYGSNSVKLISAFHEGEDIYALDQQTFNLSNGSGYTLNSSNVSNYMNMNNAYVGSFYYDNANYENTTMKINNAVYRVYKSLPKIGEVFTVPIDNNSIWTLNVFDATTAYSVGVSGLSRESYSTVRKLLYTTYISSNNVIMEGIGTYSDPYKLQ